MYIKVGGIFDLLSRCYSLRDLKGTIKDKGTLGDIL